MKKLIEILITIIEILITIILLLVSAWVIAGAMSRDIRVLLGR